MVASEAGGGVVAVGGGPSWSVGLNKETQKNNNKLHYLGGKKLLYPSFEKVIDVI